MKKKLGLGSVQLWLLRVRSVREGWVRRGGERGAERGAGGAEAVPRSEQQGLKKGLDGYPLVCAEGWWL